MLREGETRYRQDLDPRLWTQGRSAAAGAPEAREPPEPREFAEELPVGDRPEDAGRFSRRGFLAALGLSSAAFASACSRSPVGHVLPFNDKPEELTPGVPLHYASTCGGCAARCGALVKTRDGRPIKLEGNDRDPLTRGGMCAVGQASVLSLYDAARSRGPSLGDRDTTWDALDAEVRAGLSRAAAAGKAVFVVTAADLGPTETAALGKLIAAFPTARRALFDTTAAPGIAAAHAATHGLHVVPDYRLDRADVVVSIGADFLGTWLSPVAFTRDYALARAVPSKDGGAAGRTGMLRHLHVEPKLTLTGSNADVRFTARPSDTVPLLAALCRALRAAPGEAPEPKKDTSSVYRALWATLDGIRAPELAEGKVRRLAAELLGARGRALVLCGSNDPAALALTNLVNELAGAYGGTIDLAAGVPLPEGLATFDEVLAALRRGEVGAVVFWGTNPAYAHPRGAELRDLLAKVDLTVATSDRKDETASLAKFHAPDHHPLESWGDSLAVRGVLRLRQATVRPIFDTRSAIASMLRWAGEKLGEDDLLRARWEVEVAPRVAGGQAVFQSMWDAALQDGLVELGEPPAAPVAPEEAGAEGPPSPAPAEIRPIVVFRPEKVAAALSRVAAAGAAPADLELWAYETVALRDGRMANNAWLQELPDPISKATWGNHACLSAALANEIGVTEGDLVQVGVGGDFVTLPVLVEPGVHPRVVAVALGYGRAATGANGDGVGVRVAHLVREVGRVTVERTPGRKEPAKSQTHGSQEGRDIVRETTLAALMGGKGKDAAGHGAPAHGAGGHGNRRLSMWPGHVYSGPKWEMAVDLSACTGCGACVIACQAENNIPSVGELEVRRRREMHWMRIDRYFAGSADEPSVVHQPMLCQHCDNAPCETVCPVLATVHSSEGLNQQVYNRCVGTRYCANNCPPKVRRFNWFDYPHEDPLERMVLNPDVAVRSRGVMEKCSFCVQRIQEGKAAAKSGGRAVADGDFQTACQQSCPAGAIVFGDRNDPESQVAKLAADARRYRILEELNIESAVSYLAKVRATSDSPSHAEGTEADHG